MIATAARPLYGSVLSLHWFFRSGVVCLAVLLASLLGAISQTFPLVAVVLLIPMILAWTITNAYVRLWIVLFGGLTVLQSSEGLGTGKILYLFACFLIVCIAILRIHLLHDTIAIRMCQVFLLSSAVWTFVVLYTLPLAHLRGTDIMNWLRDSVPYLLLAVVPVIAIDVVIPLQKSPESKIPQWTLVVYGVLSTLGFTSHWLSQRGIAELPMSGMLFSTMIVPTLLYCFALSKAFHGDSHKTAWIVLAVFTAAMVTGTGTRTSLLLFIVPLAVLAFQRRVSIGRMLANGFVYVMLACVIAIFLGTIGARWLNVDIDSIGERIVSVTELTSDSDAGQSFVERSTVTEISWDAFYSAPVSGLGPGHVYEWEVPYSRDMQTAFILDSPFALVAKFGIMGVLAFGGTLLALWVLQRTLVRFGGGHSVAGSTIQCFLAATLLFALLGSPIDDKGFSFSVLLLLIVGLQELLTLRHEEM